MKNLKNKFTFFFFFSCLFVGSYSYGGSKGKKLFEEKEYLEAAKSFKKEKSKDSSYWLGKSLLNLEMYYSSSFFYINALKDESLKDKHVLNEIVLGLKDLNDQIPIESEELSAVLQKNEFVKSLSGVALDYSQFQKALALFKEKKYKEAESIFLSINSKSPFYLESNLFLGISATLTGRIDEGFDLLHAALGKIKNKKEFENAALLDEINLNIGRIYYEKKKFKDSLKSYSQVSRLSKYWVEAAFEASWSFYRIAKYNNTLGSLHTVLSPFYEKYFYAEAYFLQAISFLKMCRFDELNKLIKLFHTKYEKNLKSFSSFVEESQSNHDLYHRIYLHTKDPAKSKNKKLAVYLDGLTYTDEFEKAYKTSTMIDKELARIHEKAGEWGALGRAISPQLNTLKKKTQEIASERLIRKASSFVKKINDISEQIKIIHAEMLLGNVDKVRDKLQKNKDSLKNDQFIGGMKELKLGEALEYWPFEGEYWEDELGGYVYNLNNLCKKH